MMPNRKGKMVKWEMANGNEEWVGVDQMRNIEKVYKFMVQNKKMAMTLGFTYSGIARGTGIGNQQVTNAVHKLVYKRINPPLKLKAPQHNGKTFQRAILIRLINSK